MRCRLEGVPSLKTGNFEDEVLPEGGAILENGHF